MQIDVSGKQVLVTGGSSGIGRDLARAFAQGGAQVAVTGRREEPLRAAAGEIGALAIPGDVGDAAHAADAVARCIAEFGGLTTLVNNAGVLGTGGTADTPPEEWGRIMGVNVMGVVHMTKAAIPHLCEAEGASVLNVGSVAGTKAFAGATAYCVSKAAVDMLTRCQALELAPRKVRVNCLAPGIVVTNLHQGLVPDYEAFLQRGRETHPLGEVGYVRDTTALGLFLCSDAAGWITGGIFPVDGGRALS